MKTCSIFISLFFLMHAPFVGAKPSNLNSKKSSSSAVQVKPIPSSLLELRDTTKDTEMQAIRSEISNQAADTPEIQAWLTIVQSFGKENIHTMGEYDLGTMFYVPLGDLRSSDRDPITKDLDTSKPDLMTAKYLHYIYEQDLPIVIHQDSISLQQSSKLYSRYSRFYSEEDQPISVYKDVIAKLPYEQKSQIRLYKNNLIRICFATSQRFMPVVTIKKSLKIPAHLQAIFNQEYDENRKKHGTREADYIRENDMNRFDAFCNVFEQNGTPKAESVLAIVASMRSKKNIALDQKTHQPNIPSLAKNCIVSWISTAKSQKKLAITLQKPSQLHGQVKEFTPKSSLNATAKQFFVQDRTPNTIMTPTKNNQNAITPPSYNNSCMQGQTRGTTPSPTTCSPHSINYRHSPQHHSPQNFMAQYPNQSQTNHYLQHGQGMYRGQYNIPYQNPMPSLQRNPQQYQNFNSEYEEHAYEKNGQQYFY